MPNVLPLETPVQAEYNEDMRTWRDSTDVKLKGLFQDLANFEQLDDLLVQIGAEPKETIQRPWLYVYASAMDALLSSVPRLASLETLTLDLYAGYRDDTSGSQHDHGCLCPRIAAILPYVPRVYIRLQKSCGSLFATAHDFSVQSIRLKSLIVKLHMPYHEGEPKCRAPLWCRGDGQGVLTNVQHHGDGHVQGMQHYREMKQGAQTFLDTLGCARAEAGDPSSHGLEHLCISCPWPGDAADIKTMDVINKRFIMHGSEFFVYEDEGEDCWDEDEKWTDLVVIGGLDKALRS